MRIHKVITIKLVFLVLGFLTQVSVNGAQGNRASADLAPPVPPLRAAGSVPSPVDAAIDRIEALGRNQDVGDIAKLANEIEARFAKQDVSAYAVIMDNICQVLESDVFRQKDEAQRLALDQRCALSGLRNADLADVSVQSDLVTRTRAKDLSDLRSGKLSGEAWALLRNERAISWLLAWKRVVTGIDPAFDITKVIYYVHVMPPASTGLPPGADPSLIKDPDVRQTYENEIARNAAVGAKVCQQSKYMQVLQRFRPSLVNYMTWAYSQPPEAPNELQQLLTTYVSDQDLKSEIVKAVQVGTP